ncbi:MAG TPA: hypothetical protein VHS96_05515 [Bacteroidia bacterium]|jgi:hypothetical protein|nr:hypothetical protein [Bacteroidia bacterium]
MRNLANIGFEAHSLEEFQALAEMVYRKGKPHRAGRNQYYCYEDPSGGELWVQIDDNDEIAGMNCHFHTENAIPVELLHAQGYEERPLDGTLEARALHVDAGLSAQTAPAVFAFDLPDAHLLPKVVLPAEGQVQLVGFAREVHVYENVEDYRKAHPGKPLEGLRSIDQDLSGDRRLSALMRLDGIVLQAALKHNAYTRQSFYWLEIKTVFGKMDVVAASRSLPFVPQQGQVFDADVRLSGRATIKDAHPQKTGLIERMFWG